MKIIKTKFSNLLIFQGKKNKLTDWQVKKRERLLKRVKKKSQ